MCKQKTDTSVELTYYGKLPRVKDTGFLLSEENFSLK